MSMRKKEKNIFCSLEDELGIKIKKKNDFAWFHSMYINPYSNWANLAQQYYGQPDNDATRARMRQDFSNIGYSISNHGNGCYTVSSTYSTNYINAADFMQSYISAGTTGEI